VVSGGSVGGGGGSGGSGFRCGDGRGRGVAYASDHSLTQLLIHSTCYFAIRPTDQHKHILWLNSHGHTHRFALPVRWAIFADREEDMKYLAQDTQGSEDVAMNNIGIDIGQVNCNVPCAPDGSNCQATDLPQCCRIDQGAWPLMRSFSRLLLSLRFESLCSRGHS
jgi:hypothetical protein